MSPSVLQPSTILAREAVTEAAETALSRVPPLWPLRHFVAVNPFEGLAHLPFVEACALLRRTAGAAPLLAASDYREMIARGEITAASLASVADHRFDLVSLDAALAEEVGSPCIPLPTVADLLDAERPRGGWSEFVAEEISKWCAAVLDDNQSAWKSPWHGMPLWTAWREGAQGDSNPEAAGLKGFRAFVASLPEEADEALAACVAKVLPPGADLVEFLHRQLLTVPGWAGMVRYAAREDSMRGRSNPAPMHLLAIRLAYDAALFEAFGNDGIFRADWRHAAPRAGDRHGLEALCTAQAAYEAGWRQHLGSALAAAPSTSSTGSSVAFQAMFCIDVRSEVFRRHLEAAAPGCKTLGFAGFFGFAVAHGEQQGGRATSRCPVLLVPGAASCDTATPATSEAPRRAWRAFQSTGPSAFAFVETLGLGFALAGDRAGAASARPRPVLDPAVALAQATGMAEAALRFSSFTSGFAPIVLLCGHGSRSANNPHASSLDCGACGGHAGDVNARLAAATLNHVGVRAELAKRGIVVPETTRFVAGLHDTTTDEITLLDIEEVLPSHRAPLNDLKEALRKAGDATRRERAPKVGIEATDPQAMLDEMRLRAVHVAEVRPEWGLAGNAALVAAPRSRTRGMDLGGRVFLHDYDPSLDTDSRVLTLILTAPVVVASWINLQYYASRVDHARYGAGDKTLHQVAAGLGVVEGNGGDLKVGLPLQSLHDGTRFVHEPRRLSVFIESEPARIDAVLAAHPAVRNLFDHGWIHLACLVGDRVLERTPSGWR